MKGRKKKKMIKNKPPIFRASYSILNSWERGYAQDAINSYFKLERKTNIYMEAGLKFHKAWEDYINKNKEIHPQLSTKKIKLKNPICELKLEMPINDHMEFVGVIDCLDEPTILEFKSGTNSASNYASSKQVPLYSLLAEYHGYKVNKGIYYHWNQYFKETECSMIWLTDQVKKEAKKWLVKVGDEMYNYLLINKYYEKYSQPSSKNPTIAKKAVLPDLQKS